MELQDYLDVVRKRWRVILLVTLAVLGIAAGYTVLAPKHYSSTATFFVSTSSGDVSQLQQGNTFTQQRVKSYAQLLETPKVLDPVIASLQLPTTSEKLAEQVTAEVPLDTVLIDVTATASSAEQAAAIAGAIGKAFPSTIDEIERLKQDQGSPVKVTLVTPAAVEPTPVSPKPTRNLALGLVLGLLAGLGVALLRDRLDTSVKSPRDLDEVTDAAVVGAIAFDPDASAHPLIVHADPHSTRSEAFRSLRTNLQFLDVSDPPQSIVVTSSIPGEGKTTTVANLAISLAQAGSSVCVVEGDLRRPRLLDYLGHEGPVGLTDVLVGRVGVDDVLQPFGRSGVWLLGSGVIPPNPSELLGSPNMAKLVTHLTERFDHVLVDAPPLLPVTDAAVLSTVVDGALVVVGAGIVSRDQVAHALDALRAVNGNVLGLVANRVEAKDSGSAYAGYAYRYAPDVSSHARRSEVRRAQRAAG